MSAMRTIGIREAKKHLSRLVDRAAKGEPFIIAKAGKPLVKVVPLDALPEREMKRLGFMAGQIEVPDDFDSMFADEIEEMFYGDKRAYQGARWNGLHDPARRPGSRRHPRRHIEACLAIAPPRLIEGRLSRSRQDAPGGDASRPPAPQRGPRRLAFLNPGYLRGRSCWRDS